jgi:hypothetical protein
MLLWKTPVAMQIHLLLCKASGSYGDVTAVAAVICCRYEESAGATEVIGRQEKSVIAMIVTGCYANSLVAMQSQGSLWRGYGCCGKSAVAMKNQWVLWMSLVARKIQC